MRTRARQGGWVGLIGLLVALLIVVLLGRTLMKQLGPSGSETQPAAAVVRSGVKADAATPAPVQALERARAVDAQLQQHAREQMERIDNASK